MSASDLLERIKTLPPDQPIDWQAIREEIHREFDSATASEDRVILLAIFTAVMDMVERNVAQSAPEQLEQLRNARLNDYRLLLVKESLAGGNVSADTLIEVTDREIAAGRMSPDDDLRTTALKGAASPHPSRTELIAMAEKQRAPGGLRGAFRRIFRG